jgi:hypothetical protein
LLHRTQQFSQSAQSYYDFVRHSRDFCSVSLLQLTQPFCYSTQSLYDFVSHFATMNSAFCYIELNHFAIVNLDILKVL